jgi:uncharacterized protein (TIGR00369 family)
MSDRKVPEGFKPVGNDSSFNDVVKPLFIKHADIGPVFGLFVEKQHCNPIQICHGGAMMTLMDMALSSAVCFKLGKFCGTPTVNISLDFISSAKEGDWIEARILSSNLTRTLGFSNGLIEGPRGTVARASGCFKLPNDLEAAPGMSIEEYYDYLENTG